MRSVAAVMVALAAALLTGCAGVVSLHPASVPDAPEAVFEPALTGVWEEVKANSDGVRTRYSLVQHGKGYDVTVPAGPEELRQVRCSLQLLKSGGLYLMDIYWPSDSVPPPVHIFARLRWEKDSMWVAEMQSDWLKEQIRTRGQLKHELLTEDPKDPDRIVLTGPPAELRRYLLPYLKENRAFEEESELRRVK